MSMFLIEARDTLVLGDGKRVGEPGSHRSLDFPWPSTLAGTLRTEAGRDPRSGRFAAESKDVLKWQVRGPFLAELGEEDEVLRLLFPSPGDAVIFEGKEKDGAPSRPQLRALKPSEESFLSDLPSDLKPLLFSKDAEAAKPSKQAPRYWSQLNMWRWLVSPADIPNWSDEHSLAAVGRQPRVSVAMSSDTGTGLDGALFEVEHVVWRQDLSRRFAVAAEIDRPLDARTVGLGGERRLSFLRPTRWQLPPPPFELIDKLRKSRKARLILTTPAIFDQGYRPSSIPGARLIAASVGRPQTISGWDWACGRPKAARRCAPAGSVYWVDLNDGVDPEKWLAERWLQSLSSDPQDQRDGFGLTLVGAVE